MSEPGPCGQVMLVPDQPATWTFFPFFLGWSVKFGSGAAQGQPQQQMCVGIAQTSPQINCLCHKPDALPDAMGASQENQKQTELAIVSSCPVER